VFEEGEHGVLYLASDDGRQEEGVLKKWKKAREREINFGYNPSEEWRNGC
jgi:hypothetical protein